MIKCMQCTGSAYSLSLSLSVCLYLYYNVYDVKPYRSIAMHVLHGRHTYTHLELILEKVCLWSILETEARAKELCNDRQTVR